MTLDARAMAALQETFLEESFEGLERTEAGLLRLDADAPREVIDDLFRAIHSIKGGAGAFRVDELVDLAHAMESLLDDLRSGAAPTPEIRTTLLAGVDALRLALTERKAGRQVERRAHAGLCARLTALRGRGGSSPARSEGDWTVAFAPHPTLMRRGNDPLRLVRELVTLGGRMVSADLSRLPALDTLDPTSIHLGWRLVVPGAVERAAIDEVFAWVDDECDLAIEREAPRSTGPAEVPAPPAAEAPAVARREPPAARETAPPIGSIRVGVDKIDMLMNMVGELVITQSMLGELDRDAILDELRVERLRDGLVQLARNTRQLQESVVRLRSQPIGVVLSRLPRLVHDLEQRLGKEADLDLGDQSIELDKTVLEKLGDPLVHIVRNCIDHGIETPAARVAAGKPRRGKIEIHASHRGAAIVIEVRDDGRGLDRDRILETARQRGVIERDAQLSDDDVAQLIFAPGFSTAAEVSEVSGRGVGMDVVWRSVKALGGDVRVDSRPGLGTRTTLRLPLTLAIVDGQLVRLADQIYVVPLLSIVETLQVEPARRRRIAGGIETYRVRDEVVPVIDLAAVFGLRSDRADSQLLMIVEGEGVRLGLVVDELMAQQQVVIKSLETNFGRVDGLAGATILGDGRVAFIVDIIGLSRDVLRLTRSPDATRRDRAA